MKLKSIFIKGFKSFADPTKINVSDHVTVVVGPNGSGKSNVVDAIRWMLGEHSMKEVRIDEKEDVIFWGNQKKAPSSSAYVELEFEGENGSVTIARELERDGTNKYYINGDVVRLKDIREFLMRNGFGKGLNYIVSQGQIDKLVGSGPYTIREMIQEAAGIAIYKEKKKEALSKLDATQANLNRITDILFEVEKNRKSLYLKAKRAERYKEYSQALEEVKKRYYGGLFNMESKRLNDLNNYYEQIRLDIRERLKKLAQLELQWSNLKEEFNQIDGEMESFTKTLEEFKKRETQLLEVKENITRRLNETENKYIELTTKIDMSSEEKKTLEGRKEEIKIILEKLSSQTNSLESDLSSVEKERQEIYSAYTEKEKEIMKKKQEYEEIEKRISKLKNELIRLEESNEDIQKRLSTIDNQRIIKKERFEELESEIEDLETHLTEITEKENKLLQEIEAFKEGLNSLQERKNSLLQQEADLIRRHKEITAEIDVIKKQISEYQGYGYAIRKLFEHKADFKGLMDVVGNVLGFSPELVTAYETLLGGAVQHIIIQSADDAKDMIEFLKVNQYGRATFIPLDLIDDNFNKIPDVEKEDGFIGYAALMIKVPEEYSKIPYYLFGNDLIVKTIDDAIRIKKKLNIRSRIVTLDGEIISGKGAITGGKSKEEHGSIISRRVRLKALEEELNKVSSEKENVSSELKSVEQEISLVSKNIQLLREELSNVTSKSASSKRVLEELLRSKKEIEKELEELEKLHKEYTLKRDGNLARIETVRTEELELSNAKKLLETDVLSYSGELDTHRKKIEELNERIATLRADIKALQERNIQYSAELNRVEDRIQKIIEEHQEAQELIKKYENEMDNLRKLLVENEREYSTLKKTSEDIFTSLKDRKTGKEQKIKELEDYENEIKKIKEEIESFKEHSHSTELRIQEVNFKISSIPEEYRSPIEVSEEELESLFNELSSLENKIKMLGPVDESAIEEYEAVDKEYNELYKEKLDLEDAKKKLVDLIERTDKEALEKYMESFNKINRSFKNYIENLFFGGTGQMKFIDEENILESGIEISISKLGKRVQKLQLLSGGEKALVGIALIMSILDSNPNVFYVLDEVDAPLDEYNVEKFKKLLQLENSQFIVITHNKMVMEAGELIHGVTMIDQVSKVIEVKLEEVLA